MQTYAADDELMPLSDEFFAGTLRVTTLAAIEDNWYAGCFGSLYSSLIWVHTICMQAKVHLLLKQKIAADNV